MPRNRSMAIAARVKCVRVHTNTMLNPWKSHMCFWREKTERVWRKTGNRGWTMGIVIFVGKMCWKKEKKIILLWTVCVIILFSLFFSFWHSHSHSHSSSSLLPPPSSYPLSHLLLSLSLSSFSASLPFPPLPSPFLYPVISFSPSLNIYLLPH